MEIGINRELCENVSAQSSEMSSMLKQFQDPQAKKQLINERDCTIKRSLEQQMVKLLSKGHLLFGAKRLYYKLSNSVIEKNDNLALLYEVAREIFADENM